MLNEILNDTELAKKIAFEVQAIKEWDGMEGLIPPLPVYVFVRVNELLYESWRWN